MTKRYVFAFFVLFLIGTRLVEGQNAMSSPKSRSIYRGTTPSETAQDEKIFRRVLCLWMWGSSGDVDWTWLTARFP